MAKTAYIGINNVARQIKNIYVGVDNVARQVVAAYIGVGDKARLWWAEAGVYSQGVVGTLPAPVYLMGSSAFRTGLLPGLATDLEAVFAGGISGGAYLDDAYCYNASYTKTNLPALTTPRAECAGSWIIGTEPKAIFFGGQSNSGSTSVGTVNTAECYSVTGTKISIYNQNVTVGRMGMQGVSFGTKVVFIGGITNYLTPYKANAAVITITQDLTMTQTANLSTDLMTRTEYSCASVEDGAVAIYFGGFGSTANMPNTTVMALTPNMTTVTVASIETTMAPVYSAAASTVSAAGDCFAICAGGACKTAATASAAFAPTARALVVNDSLSLSYYEDALKQPRCRLKATSIVLPDTSVRLGIFAGGTDLFTASATQSYDTVDLFIDDFPYLPSPALTVPRAGFGIETIGSKAFIVGGRNLGSSDFDSVEVFEAIT